jgi:hypothetical protein
MKMIKVTKVQLFLLLENNYVIDDVEFETPISEEVCQALHRLQESGDLVSILAVSYYSELHPGGDDVVEIVDETVRAIQRGLSVIAWYGEKAQALIVGYNPDKIQIID